VGKHPLSGESVRADVSSLLHSNQLRQAKVYETWRETEAQHPVVLKDFMSDRELSDVGMRAGSPMSLDSHWTQ